MGVSMLSAAESELVKSTPTGMFVRGEWLPASRGTFAVEDPATGDVIAEVADAGPAEGLAALEAADAARAEWAAVPPRERGEILRRAFEQMRRQGEELALLITLEMGKPLAESRAEMAYAAEFFRWFSEEAVRIDGQYYLAPNGTARVLTMRQPVGPALLVTPWNFPLAMGTRKIGAALAAGCTVVIKPAEQTPLSILALAQVLADAGLPPGVLNVVTTSTPAEVVSPLIADGRVRKISFTGSTEVGVRLLEQAARNVLRVSMELGGNAPFLVFADADLDAAVTGAMLAKMRNMGEACTSANRFFVDVQVAEEFAHRLAERMAALRTGRGTDPGVQVGPLIDAAGRAKVAALVADAQDRGARTLLGGQPLEGPGYFFAPTVLDGVTVDAHILHEEVFGPVAAIVAFSSEADGIALANSTEYGLASYVYTRDVARAFRVVEALEVGMVGVNRGMVSEPAAPFGGVKHSGLGREGGREGIDEFLDTKYASISI
jgi:succinate-semialdehyde dehydrogenase/glutarate-semialdehyde dehydrogenase